MNLSNFLDLIKNRKHAAIMFFVQECKYLGVEGESALIDRGNHSEIMAYLISHRPEPESFDKLLKRGNHQEIAVCIIIHGFNRAYLPHLGAFWNEIVYSTLDSIGKYHWVQEFYLSLDDQIALLNSNNHQAKRLYFSLYPLHDRAIQVLQEKGSDMDKLVFDALQNAKPTTKLSPKKELLLMREGNTKDILYYFVGTKKEYGYAVLAPKSFNAFMRRKNLDEVRLYLALDGFLQASDMETLFSVGKEISYDFVCYLSRNQEKFEHLKTYHSLSALLRYGDHSAFRAFILTAKRFYLSIFDLAIYGTPEDLLVYELVRNRHRPSPCYC